MKIKYWIPILLIVFIFSFTACNTPKAVTETTAKTTIIETTVSETTAAVTTIPETTAEKTTIPETTTKSKIAFTSNRDGNYEIYIMNIDGSGQANLTNNPANDDSPSFSPDGSKIVFTSNRDGNYEIYIMNVDGSKQVRLTNNPANDVNPSFSPVP